MLRAITSLLLLALLLALPPERVGAQAPQPFYRGKQLNMVIASGAGGGYDTYARTLARHMTKHIPGNPVIVAVPIICDRAQAYIDDGSVYFFAAGNK